jgi:hypothetical protein
MNLEELLARLKGIDVKLDEDRRLSDGTRILILTCLLGFFPLAPHHRWYTLVISPNQQDVPQYEVEAILRHFWHGELDWFKHETGN